jgi:hypothetical protein
MRRLIDIFNEILSLNCFPQLELQLNNFLFLHLLEEVHHYSHNLIKILYNIYVIQYEE